MTSFVSPILIDESTIAPTIGPHALKDPSPLKGLIIRGMLRKIQIGFSQEGQNHHRLHMLFSWAEEDIKI